MAIPKWPSIEEHEVYKTASPEKQQLIRETYFEKFVKTAPGFNPAKETDYYNKLFGKKDTTISALTPAKVATLSEPFDVTDLTFDKAVQDFTDKLITVHTGKSLDQLSAEEKFQRNVLGRAPLLGMAFASPLISLGFEALNQAKNAVVTAVKKEPYSPLEQRILSELLPETLPMPVRLGSSLVENLADIALMGGLANVATRGLLKQTISELGTKLEKAGYGSGKVTISEAAIKQAAKGTTLEAEAARYLKMKEMKIQPTPKTAMPGGPEAPAPPPPGLPLSLIHI